MLPAIQPLVARITSGPVPWAVIPYTRPPHDAALSESRSFIAVVGARLIVCPIDRLVGAAVTALTWWAAPSAGRERA